MNNKSWNPTGYSMNCFIPPSLELFLAVPIVQVYGPIFPVLKVWHEYWTKHFLYYIKCVLHGWIPIFILCRENQEKYCYLNLMIKWFWWCSVHTLWKKKIYVVPFTLPLVASLTCFSHKHSMAEKKGKEWKAEMEAFEWRYNKEIIVLEKTGMWLKRKRRGNLPRVAAESVIPVT